MTAPLPTLRHGVRGKAKDAPVSQSYDVVGIRILHLAEKEQNYERALCGRKRDKPLEPNASGEMCVVCADIYWRKHGCEWRPR